MGWIAGPLEPVNSLLTGWWAQNLPKESLGEDTGIGSGFALGVEQAGAFDEGIGSGMASATTGFTGTDEGIGSGAAAGGQPHADEIVEFTTVGTTNYTVPSWANCADIVCLGGGAGGGCGGAGLNVGEGGFGGSWGTITLFRNRPPGSADALPDTLRITVGAAGTGSPAYGVATNGGDSNVSANSAVVVTGQGGEISNQNLAQIQNGHAPVPQVLVKNGRNYVGGAGGVGNCVPGTAPGGGGSGGNGVVVGSNPGAAGGQGKVWIVLREICGGTTTVAPPVDTSGSGTGVGGQDPVALGSDPDVQDAPIPPNATGCWVTLIGAGCDGSPSTGAGGGFGGGGGSRIGRSFIPRNLLGATYSLHVGRSSGESTVFSSGSVVLTATGGQQSVLAPIAAIPTAVGLPDGSVTLASSSGHGFLPNTFGAGGCGGNGGSYSTRGTGTAATPGEIPVGASDGGQNGGAGGAGYSSSASNTGTRPVTAVRPGELPQHDPHDGLWPGGGGGGAGGHGGAGSSYGGSGASGFAKIEWTIGTAQPVDPPPVNPPVVQTPSDTTGLTQYTGITYEMSSQYGNNGPATYEMMNNGNADGSKNGNQAGTNPGTSLPTGQYIRADLGSLKPIDRIVIGYDYMSNLPGGWGPSETAGARVQVSRDASEWVTVSVTPEYATTGSTNGLVTIPIGSTSVGGQGDWRYVQLLRSDSHYLCTLEFEVWGPSGAGGTTGTTGTTGGTVQPSGTSTTSPTFSSAGAGVRSGPVAPKIVSWTHNNTAPAGAKTIVLAFFCIAETVGGPSAGFSLSNVNYSGHPMTLIDEITSNDIKFAVYWLADPPTGAGGVNVTTAHNGTAPFLANSVIYTDATRVMESVHVSGTNSTAGAQSSIAQGETAVVGFAGNQYNQTAFSGGTMRWNNGQNVVHMAIGDTSVAPQATFVGGSCANEWAGLLVRLD